MVQAFDRGIEAGSLRRRAVAHVDTDEINAVFGESFLQDRSAGHGGEGKEEGGHEAKGQPAEKDDGNETPPGPASSGARDSQKSSLQPQAKIKTKCMPKKKPEAWWQRTKDGQVEGSESPEDEQTPNVPMRGRGIVIPPPKRHCTGS